MRATVALRDGFLVRRSRSAACFAEPGSAKVSVRRSRSAACFAEPGSAKFILRPTAAVFEGMIMRSWSAARTPIMTAVVAGVAAGHPATAAAGLRILQQGGSAADAAVAATFASCVAETVMTGLGGGGHAIVWNAARHEA